MKDKENLCNAIIKYSSDYIYTLKVKKDCITVKLENPGEGNVFGYLVDEINTLTDYVEKLVLPDDRFEVNSSVASVIKEGRNKTIEYKIKHKSGKISWVSNVLISNSKDSDLTYDAICLLKDISLRKYLEVALQQADERYRNVFDQSGLASAVFDLSGRLIMQNLMAAKFLGGVPPDFIGKSVDEIYSPEVAKYIYSTLDATLKGVCLTRENEFLISKQKVWLKTTSHCVRNGNGETIGVQLISQNITEKKEWNKRMMQVMIETEEKERNYFAQELHDGVNPLIATIKMYVQWLSMPEKFASKSEVLADIEKMVDEASQTIREISFKLSPRVLINYGLVEALRVFCSKINNRGGIEIFLKSNLSQRLGIMKETIFYRVLCESINNTMKYADASNIHISINSFQDILLIKYSDDGIGFDWDATFKESRGNGLLNIQSRLESIEATVSINTQPGNGLEMIIESSI